MNGFISEDDLQTFEGWSRYQTVDPATLTAEQLTTWQDTYEKSRQASAANRKVVLMKLQAVPGEYRYAVAVRHDTDLWLAL